ncbi:MAG TPA: hypothetical protein VGD43_09200 [Micromonospora sp.]
MLQVRSSHLGGPSTLLRVTLPSGTAVPVRKLDHHVNAIGYAVGQHRVYGIATRTGLLPIGRKTQVVTLDAEGRMVELGPVRGTGPVPVPADGLADATAGAVAGARLHLRDGGSLYTVDVNPASPSYLGILRRVRLFPAHPARTVDDFAANPTDGLLYGVASTHGGQIVRIDPTTGRVRTVPAPRGLPNGSRYGSVVLDGRTLYVTNNRVGHHSRLYRLALDGSGTVTELATGPASATSDAAGCLTVAAPPAPSPSPSPAPSTPPPPVPPRPPAPATRRPTPSTRPTSPAAPTPSRSTAAGIVPVATTGPPSAEITRPDRALPVPVDAEDTGTRTKRRWVLVLLLVVLGASLAGATGGAGTRTR